MSCQTTGKLHPGRCNFQLIWFWLFRVGVVKLPACFFASVKESTNFVLHWEKQWPEKKQQSKINGE